MTSRRIFKWVLWLLGFLLAVPALLFAALVLSPHFMGGSADVEEVADRLQPTSSWTMDYELVTPRMLGCWDGNACPSVNRSWQSSIPLSADEFLGLVEALGGDLGNVARADLCGTQVRGCNTHFHVRHDGTEFWIYLRTSALDNTARDSDDDSYDGMFTLGLIVQHA